MSWHLNTNKDLEYVELILAGETSGQDLLAATFARQKLSNELAYHKLLINTLDIIADQSATFDIYQIVNNDYEAKGIRGNIKIAITSPRDKNSIKMVEFYYTTCLNRGYNIEKFQDRETAIQWLSTI